VSSDGLLRRRGRRKAAVLWVCQVRACTPNDLGSVQHLRQALGEYPPSDRVEAEAAAFDRSGSPVTGSPDPGRAVGGLELKPAGIAHCAPEPGRLAPLSPFWLRRPTLGPAKREIVPVQWAWAAPHAGRAVERRAKQPGAPVRPRCVPRHLRSIGYAAETVPGQSDDTARK
jgi:hypothetical protein